MAERSRRYSLLVVVFMVAALLAAAGPAGGQSGGDGASSSGEPTEPLWQLESASSINEADGSADSSLPVEFQPASLNRALMAELLATAPLEYTAAAASFPLVLSIPTPDGRFERFGVEEAPAMEPALAARYPGIRSYRGRGIDDPTATLAFSNSPLGFKAHVRSAGADWSVTPRSSDGTTAEYMSFRERDLRTEGEFIEPQLDTLLVDPGLLREAGIPDLQALDAEVPGDLAAATSTGTRMRNHRIAFSTTGAYSNEFGDNVPLIVASMNGLVTYLNGIYEPELAVHFNLVAGSEDMIYTTPAPPAGGSCVSFGPEVTIDSIEGTGPPSAVRIITTTNHNLSEGDTIEIADSDDQIEGDQTVFVVLSSTEFFIFNSADVDEAETGTLRKKNLLIDPPFCDPFTPDEPGINLTINQAVADGVIGDAGYDIGHVLGFKTTPGASGVARLRAVGVTGSKAVGASHSSNVVGPTPGALQRVLRHEVGHQFGAPHTFNGIRGNCNPNNYSSDSAVEIASGSTIMSYGGICTNSSITSDGLSDDIIGTQDPYFHSWSLELMNNHLAAVGLDARGTDTILTNNPPVVDAGGVYTIPAQTPFTLSGTATDDPGDALTYIWEQFDKPEDDLDCDAVVCQRVIENPDVRYGPLFRSFPSATTGNERTFPSLDKILANNTNAVSGTCAGSITPTTDWSDSVVQCFAEFLPTKAGLVGNRWMDFRLTARDDADGVGSDDTRVRVIDGRGPFLVTAPNTAVSWAGNSVQTVTWDVAGTDTTPISAGNVDIHLSADGGQTWQLLAAGTTNDGSAQVTVPNVATTAARVRVKGAGNIFFDLSDADFTITPGSGPLDAVALADVDGDGHGELAVLLFDDAAGRFRVVTRDAVDGGFVSTANLPLTADALDLEATASGDLVVLYLTTTNGNYRLKSFDAASGAAGTTITLGTVFAYSDLEITPAGDWAAVGTSAVDGRVRVRVDEVGVGFTNFTVFGKVFTGADLEVTPTGLLAVMGERADGVVRTRVVDPSNSLWTQSIFGSAYSGTDLEVTAADMFVMGTRAADGLVRVREEPLGGGTAANSFFGPAFTGTDLEILGSGDIAVMGERPSDGQVRTAVLNGALTTFLYGTPYTGLDLVETVAGELAVLGENRTNGRIRIRHINPIGGAATNILYP